MDGIHFSPLCFHCSYRPDLVPCVCALSFRPDWDSQSSTIISMPLTSCVGGCLCYSGEEPVLPVSVVGFILKMSSQVHHQRSTPTRVIIKPISTSSINQPPKANKITSSSATLFHNPKRQNLTPTSPVTLTIMVKFTQTSSRQGRERSSSTSSFQEIIISPQSLFVRGNSHQVSKTWTIDDAGTSTSHSTTASFVASLLIAETLIMQNAMISAHNCGIKSLSLETLF